MSTYARRTIPLFITGILGVIIISDFLFVNKEISTATSLLQSWVVTIFGFSLCLGGANVFVTNVAEIRRRTPGKWYYSALLLAVMFSYIVVGVTLTTASTAYKELFNTLNFPLAQITYNLIAFYMFSAAIRAFQTRSYEATIFMLCAIFVILGNIPSISVLSPQLSQIGPWISNVPTRGAMRGFTIGATIGAIILGLRTLLGRETGYLGRG